MNRILALLVLASLAGLGSPAAAGEGKSKKKAEPAAEPARKEGGAESDDPAERRRERLGRRSRSTSPDRPARRRTEPATPSEPVPAEDDPARSDDAPASPGTPETPASDDEPLRITGKIVYGHGAAVRKAAVVDVSKVFAAIPSYRRIKSENVPKHKARYHLLLNQANQEFQAAVQAVALHDAFDLVAEKGGTEGGAPTDITDAVLARIEK